MYMRKLNTFTSTDKTKSEGKEENYNKKLNRKKSIYRHFTRLN